jgi:hypothetical protein
MSGAQLGRSEGTMWWVSCIQILFDIIYFLSITMSFIRVLNMHLNVAFLFISQYDYTVYVWPHFHLRIWKMKVNIYRDEIFFFFFFKQLFCYGEKSHGVRSILKDIQKYTSDFKNGKTLLNKCSFPSTANILCQVWHVEILIPHGRYLVFIYGLYRDIASLRTRDCQFYTTWVVNVRWLVRF